MPSSTNPAVISVERVGLNFGVEPLFADLNLQINRGEFVAIIGPNGSGKTSFVKMLYCTSRQPAMCMNQGLAVYAIPEQG